MGGGFSSISLGDSWYFWGEGAGGPLYVGFSGVKGLLGHGKFFSWVWDTSQRILNVQLGLFF